MASKPNWACVTCGMFSSRKDSVKRHIRKLHGSGPMVSYIDYISGRQSGYYPPGTVPAFVKRDSAHQDLGKVDRDAFRQGYWNEAGKQKFRRGEAMPTL